MRIMKLKYIGVLTALFAVVACNDPEDVDLLEEAVVEELPELTTGSADFSNYVAVGNSLTAGYTDGALFKASQELSMPSILASKFEGIGGGSFTQPLMNDNFGGMALGGNRILQPRLVFGGAGPVTLESVIDSVTVTTDLAVNNPTGPFNNMGVPGAKTFHLLAPGYGNIGNVAAGLANPYFVRMTGDTPDASVIQLAAGQAPTFFSLWIGNNDVLGYATTGGDGTNPLTPVEGAPGVGFEATYGALVGALTANGAKGVVSNIPDVTSVPHFTTVPHNPVPLDAATAAAVNNAYAAYNGGIEAALGALAGTGLFTEEEAEARKISFEESETNAVVIEDESLTDLGAINPAFAALPKIRQATAADLLVLPASAFIGTLAEEGNPLSVNGVAIPLADKWVLVPSEQEEIAVATTAFNAIIKSTAEAAGLAFVDGNEIMNRLANGGITSGEFTLTSNLVMGSAFSLDGVHPTSRGYALLANEFMKAIDATYGTNFEASGNLVNVGNYPTNFSPTLE